MPDDDYTDDESSFEQPSEDFKALRKKAATADRLEPENTSLRTENALLKAGLGDLNERQQKALIASHDGDLTPEALKATATELGFTVEDKPAEETKQVSDAEQAAHQRAAEATSGAQASEAEKQTLTDEINAATSPEAVVALLAREQMLPQE